MGCGCNSGGAIFQSQPAYQNSYVKNENCEITLDMITNYKRFLECVKNTGNLAAIGISTVQCNSYLGYFQSAINYPDDYCYFQIKLQDFIDNVLPKILINVPNCTE